MEVLQLMTVMNEDTRFEEAYREEGSGTNMCEYLDRIIARGESRGEIKGTIETCRRFGLGDTRILEEIMEQFHLEEQKALEFMESTKEK